MKEKLVIAIDGQSASGKGTIAARIARDFNCEYLPTGNLYRLIAFTMLSKQINLNKGLLYIDEIIKDMDYKLLYSDKLNQESIAKLASKIAQENLIRQKINQIQFDWIKSHQVAILEGRDIGTVIAPNADIKIYMVANAEARAKRRLAQYKSQGKNDQSYEKILTDLIERDEQDSSRKNAPLTKAEDAILIDSSNLTAEKVYKQISKIIYDKIKTTY